MKGQFRPVAAPLKHVDEFSAGVEPPNFRGHVAAAPLKTEVLVLDNDDMPAEIDFTKGVRGLHHAPPNAKILMPAAIERSVWEYFSGKAEQRGIDLSELLTEVLKRDIEINETLK
jgi:hypothetical protein